MNIQELMRHPELLSRETLYELREMTARYPYYQPARLLMLKNLYILQDASFDEELRRSAIYFTDRKVLFNLIEAAHYRLKKKSPQSFSTQPDSRQHGKDDDSRTVSIIDDFLSAMPEEEKQAEAAKAKEGRKHRRPTPADATVDYMAYLLSTDFEELNRLEGKDDGDENGNGNGNVNGDGNVNGNGKRNAMRGETLIDNFINNEKGKMTLQEVPQYLPEVEIEDNSEHTPDTELLTETMASIYIKQGKYRKALDVMGKMKETSQKKSIYFDDQERFLKMLVMAKGKKEE